MSDPFDRFPEVVPDEVWRAAGVLCECGAVRPKGDWCRLCGLRDSSEGFITVTDPLAELYAIWPRRDDGWTIQDAIDEAEARWAEIDAGIPWPDPGQEWDR